jgi:Ribosomal protein L17
MTMPKLFDTLASRYKNRPGGYTRIHRLPPRYGDMAPQAILELVDGKRDIHFSMTARRVARSAILGTKWLSESTKDAMYRVFQFQGQKRIKEFDEEVDRQKQLLLEEDKHHEEWLRMKEEKPIRKIEDRVFERARYTTSKHNAKKRKQLEAMDMERQRKDAYVSEEEKKAEVDRLKKERGEDYVVYNKEKAPDKEDEEGEDEVPTTPEPTVQEIRAARYEEKQERYRKRVEERRQKRQTTEN